MLRQMCCASLHVIVCLWKMSLQWLVGLTVGYVNLEASREELRSCALVFASTDVRDFFTNHSGLELYSQEYK